MALPPAFVYNSEFKPCALNGRTGGGRSRNVSTEVTTRRKPGGVYQPRPRNLRFHVQPRQNLTEKLHVLFLAPLYNAAREAYRLIKTANLIYIHNDADKQNRKELYERAQGYISASRTTILLGIAAHPAHTFTRDAGMKTVSALKSDRISWTNLRRVPQRPQIGISRRRSWTTLLYSHKC